MEVYYYMIEATPYSDNPEKETFESAFINCWVHSTDIETALTKAKAYIHEEGWSVKKIEEQFIANRNLYEGSPELIDSLECFDHALKEGVSAIFYGWPNEQE
ncbi:hypothetical protein QOZ98_000088 [Planomicrobium stackebrandtii]|uniref:Uncharacterized protein n=1 Tax=Planomicrobium stackebrandtii TaxID=253160 RepID=A0ABU0GPH1_9BACL|nr:hypothetical protein [Planomicrobium stackebrandtii]MDQ0427263.1 hypothetical protein [Planomicrobium stackebrandtii]